MGNLYVTFPPQSSKLAFARRRARGCPIDLCTRISSADFCHLKDGQNCTKSSLTVIAPSAKTNSPQRDLINCLKHYFLANWAETNILIWRVLFSCLKRSRMPQLKALGLGRAFEDSGSPPVRPVFSMPDEPEARKSSNYKSPEMPEARTQSPRVPDGLFFATKMWHFRLKSMLK